MQLQHPAPRQTVCVAAGLLLVLAAMPAIWAQPQQASEPCRISGKITSGGIALPGVAVTVLDGERTVTASSSDIDGTWRVSVQPASNYRLRVEACRRRTFRETRRTLIAPTRQSRLPTT
jgi:hypothetical protein